MNKECEGEEENLSITTSIFHRFVMLGFDVRRKKKKRRTNAVRKQVEQQSCRGGSWGWRQGRRRASLTRTATSVVDEVGDERRWWGLRRASETRTATSVEDEDSDTTKRVLIAKTTFCVCIVSLLLLMWESYPNKKTINVGLLVWARFFYLIKHTPAHFNNIWEPSK